MLLPWFPIAVCIAAISILILMMRTGVLKGLRDRPALIMCIAAAAGILYRQTGLPMSEAEIASLLAEIFLAMLAFGAAMQFRISRLHLFCPSALRLAVVAAPLFMAVAALSVFVLSPSVTLWSALIIGAILMLNGASLQRRIIASSPVSRDVKTSVAIESAAALVIGLPIAVMIETAATTSLATSASVLDSGVFKVAIGFTIGGSMGLLGGRFCSRNSGKMRSYQALAAGTGAFLLAPTLGGSAMIAACAAGLLWSEEARMKPAERLWIQDKLGQIAKPAAFILFGLILGPQLLLLDTLVLFFAISTVTLLRVVPRLIALKPLDLPTEEQNFIAWFGGAPGAASALFLLTLLGSPVIADQEMVMTISAVSIFAGVLMTRISSRPLASFFIRRAALARKRRYYA